MVRSSREMRAQRARACRVRAVVRDAHARHPRASRARDERDSTRPPPSCESGDGMVKMLKMTPPDSFGGPRLCLVRTHPSYVRPKTWVHDPRKTVLFVQFGIVRGGQMRRIDADNTTNGGRVEAAGMRQKATKNMDKDGYVLLETCNMRAAFFDAGQEMEAFIDAAERAAAASGLEVVYAARRIDPGCGLLLLHVGEPITLV